MGSETRANSRPPGGAASPLAADEQRVLLQRSDAKGLTRLALHLTAIASTGTLYGLSLAHTAHPLLVLLLAVPYGFTLVTGFAAMHESVHRTAFQSRALNDAVGWFAGLLSFYNSTFYRYYHGWHHRFTQTEKDPELSDVKPTGYLSYVVELSGITWWLGKLKTHLRIAFGKTAGYGFLNEETSRLVIRSVRLQLAVYASCIAASVALGRPLFLTFWLLPVALAQPLLRAILLAEHGGCSEDDDALSNTRTTYTVFPVRLLMWEMPYHAEHHRYPALPFFALQRAHQSVGPHLTHVARRGYLGFHLSLVQGFRKKPSLQQGDPT